MVGAEACQAMGKPRLADIRAHACPQGGELGRLTVGAKDDIGRWQRAFGTKGAGDDRIAIFPDAGAMLLKGGMVDGGVHKAGYRIKTDHRGAHLLRNKGVLLRWGQADGNVCGTLQDVFGPVGG